MTTGLADAYFELRRFREARDEYSRVLTFNPNDARALFGRARALEELGQRRAAANDYRRFLELWNDADRDARQGIEAKERLARLR